MGIDNGQPNWLRQLLLASGIIFAMTLMAIIGLSYFDGEQTHYDPVRQAAWEKIAPRLSEAENASAQAGEKYAARVKAFFAERKRGARPFSDEVLSFWGKLEFVKSLLPIAEDGSYQRFLHETFSRHLFKGDDLTSLIEACVEGYSSELVGIENQTLMNIRADLGESDLASTDILPSLASDDAFRQSYAHMVEQVLPVINRDMAMTGGREATTFIMSDIAANIALRIGTVIAARLGVSAGILETGAASSVATFGLGAVAAFVLDKIIDWVLEQSGYDPAADITAKVCASLDEIETLLLEGGNDGTQTGLRRELQRVQVFRSSVCREALRKLILEGGE
jgi:hypothetical protein